MLVGLGKNYGKILGIIVVLFSVLVITLHIQEVAAHQTFAPARTLSPNELMVACGSDGDGDGVCDEWEKGDTLEINFPPGTTTYVYDCIAEGEGPNCVSPENMNIIIFQKFISSLVGC